MKKRDVIHIIFIVFALLFILVNNTYKRKTVDQHQHSTSTVYTATASRSYCT